MVKILVGIYQIGLIFSRPNFYNIKRLANFDQHFYPLFVFARLQKYKHDPLFTQARFLDFEEQLNHLESHLVSQGKTIRRVARDGLCVLRSVHEVLKEKSITLSVDELKRILRQEVSQSSYSHFACADDPVSGLEPPNPGDDTGEVDPLSLVDQFLKNPAAQYANPVVDIVLPALMNGLKASGIVYKTDDRGQISQLQVGPEMSVIRDCFFAQTSVRHLDAVVNITAKAEPSVVDYNCSTCKRSFGGPKRLARHDCVVKSETKKFSHVFTNDSSSPIVLDDDEEEETLFKEVNDGYETALDFVDEVDDNGTVLEDEMNYDDLDGDDDDDEDNNCIDENNHDDAVFVPSEQIEGAIRAYGPQKWIHITPIRVDRIPYDINGKCIYNIKASSRAELLHRCSDGRPWSGNSTTKWHSYDTRVRYKNCGGSLMCPRLDCEFKEENGVLNRLKFGKNKVRYQVFHH